MTRALSETIVPIRDADRLMTMFVDHLRDDHGVEMAVAPDGTRILDQDAFRIGFAARPDGLRVALEGPTQNALLFIKEEIFHHVEEIDPQAAHLIRWTGESAAAGERPPNFHVPTVTESYEIFPGMQRVTLHCPDVAGRADEGIHLRLMMPKAPDRTPRWPVMGEVGVPVWPQGDDTLHARFVTIKASDSETGLLTIDIARHAHGLISRWAQEAAPGQIVGAMGPAGQAVLPEADPYLLAANATGLPAVSRFLASMRRDMSGDVVVAAPRSCDLLAYLGATSLRVHRIGPDAFEAEVGDIVRRLTADNPPGDALFLGEFANAQDLRRHFKKDLGLGKGMQIAAAYWRRGTPGFGS